MDAKESVNPLSEESLKKAAEICFATALLGVFPSETEECLRNLFLERTERFKYAQNVMREDEGTSLRDLKLLAEDCKWATTNAIYAKNVTDWITRFRKAEEMLRISQ